MTLPQIDAQRTGAATSVDDATNAVATSGVDDSAGVYGAIATSDADTAPAPTS
jgi:hypothetical protein